MDTRIDQMTLNRHDDDDVMKMPRLQYHEVLPALVAGLEAAWPNQVWTMGEGEYKLTNENLLFDFGTGPVIAWHGEQLWQIASLSVGKRIIADLHTNSMANFGVRIKGFWCESPASVAAAVFASLSLISKNNFDLDEVIDRFRICFAESTGE